MPSARSLLPKPMCDRGMAPENFTTSGDGIPLVNQFIVEVAYISRYEIGTSMTSVPVLVLLSAE